MAKLKKFEVSATVTISIGAIVYAEDEEQAFELAANLMMPDIIENTRYNEPGVSHEEWRTGGELDGEAQDIEVTEVDDD